MLLDLADGKRPQAKENLMSGCHTENQIHFLTLKNCISLRVLALVVRTGEKKRGCKYPSVCLSEGENLKNTNKHSTFACVV